MARKPALPRAAFRMTHRAWLPLVQMEIDELRSQLKEANKAKLEMTYVVAGRGRLRAVAGCGPWQAAGRGRLRAVAGCGWAGPCLLGP